MFGLKLIMIRSPISHYYSDPLKTIETELKLRGYSKKTIKAYLYYNEKFLGFVGKSPKYVKANDIKVYVEYLIDKGLEKDSINLAISAILFYYKKVMKRRFQIPRLKRDKKLMPVLSKEEVKKIIGCAQNPKHKLLLEVLYSTGLRVSECAKLRVSDFDLDRKLGKARSGKGGKDRYFILSDVMVDHLLEFIGGRNEGYVFRTRKGYYRNRTIQAVCSKYTKKADVSKNVTPHTFRRSFAVHLIEDGYSVFQVKILLGHQQISTTQRYLAQTKTELQKIRNPLDVL